jgi:hypothetical protein
MAKTQDHQMRDSRRPAVSLPPPRPRHRLRASLVLVPMSLLLAAWVLNRVQPAMRWPDILQLLGVRDRQRFSMLAVLILTLAAIWFVKRIWVRK